MSKWAKIAAGGMGAAAAAVMVVVGVLFVGLYILRPRRVMREFDALLLRHPVGSPVSALIDDPFVEEVSMADWKPAGGTAVNPTTSVGPTLVAVSSRERPSLSRFRGEVKAKTEGLFELMWTHTPPFGRLFLSVGFRDGKVTDLHQSELD